jgi:hypothetical protein
MDYERLSFSYNWNKKLHCDCFTTIRLFNPNKYSIGKKFRLFLRDIHLKDVEIIEIKVLKLDQINIFISSLDTGYEPETTKQIIKKMYAKCNWETQQIYLILLKTINKKIPV